ncbi:hypothetical protein WJX74_009638 [Apatococcus lobatus]|uniref:FAD-binding PCMH-type domain-containing protein n=1 Tax=Apatococcus lobatus TaxID=904363 RepID=A0AAW1S0H0_9CHLO
MLSGRPPSRLQAPQYPSNPPPDFPIHINEDESSVTAAAGVSQRLLLDYLANFKSSKASNGYTLGAFSWFVDQTIGGAVATGTHGSSFKFNSLSSQLLALDVVLANGTLTTFTKASYPHLWKALQISVGRLGIITQLTLRIIPQQAVQRSQAQLSDAQFAQQIKLTQDAYTSALDGGNQSLVVAALAQLDETQVFWFVPTQNAWRVDYQKLDPSAVAANSSLSSEAANTTQAGGSNPSQSADTVSAMDGPSAPDVHQQVALPAQAPNPALAGNARWWSNFYANLAQQTVAPGVFMDRQAYLSQTDSQSKQMQNMDPYDQYEVSVPLNIAGDCLQMVVNEASSKNLGDGFRVPVLIRFIGDEQAYLANAHGGPRMFVNMEDHVSRQTGQPNHPFLQMVGLFRDKCQARLHWGKAGWPEFASCFDGATEYPDSWCDFGCAVQELDPCSKFESMSNVWQWNATKGASPVDFASCCGSDGFSTDCQCVSRGTC